MTSHYRHRRDSNAAAVAPTLEKGEVYVNTANRQMAVGNVADGQPLFLIAVRYFDTRSQYAAGDFVANAGKLYVAQANISPGTFNPAQWFAATKDPGDTTDLSSYLLKSGGVMTGPLTLAGPPGADLEAATRKYVDDAKPPPPAANLVPSTPVGAIAATNVQAAIAELDAEKVPIAGGTMTGHLTLPTTPAAANAVRKDYVDAATAANTTAIAGKVNKTGDTMTGALNVTADVNVSRNATQGYVFLGSNGAHYVGFDGTNYILPNGGLGVGGAVAAGAGTFSGMLTSNGGYTNPVNTQHTLNNNGVYFASAAASTIMIQGPPYPTIAFHCQGYFGANFGMNTDGNFYMGGWSHGEGVAYKFWTTRDFSANPGNPLVNARWVYLGDVDCGFNGPLQEPWAGAGITGISGPSSYNAFTSRFRQFQIQVADGTWVATGYA